MVVRHLPNRRIVVHCKDQTLLWILDTLNIRIMDCLAMESFIEEI